VSGREKSRRGGEGGDLRAQRLELRVDHVALQVVEQVVDELRHLGTRRVQLVRGEGRGVSN